MVSKNVQWLALAMLLCAIVATAAEDVPAATIAGKYNKPPSDTYYDEHHEGDHYRGSYKHDDSPEYKDKEGYNYGSEGYGYKPSKGSYCHCGGNHCPTMPNPEKCTCDTVGTGLVKCGSSCVDPMSSPQCCGGAVGDGLPGVTCAIGQICVMGNCTCPGSSQELCGEPPACVDTLTDPNNCGGCGNDPCPLGQTCVAGTCGCGDGLDSCCGGLFCAVPLVCAAINGTEEARRAGTDNCPVEATCLPEDSSLEDDDACGNGIDTCKVCTGTPTNSCINGECKVCKKNGRCSSDSECCSRVCNSGGNCKANNQPRSAKRKTAKRAHARRG